ncbi:MAG: amidohydrolase [Saprospiraceae bacterium]|nr:amidohydrolase [Saprospiraceae bacterium]
MNKILVFIFGLFIWSCKENEKADLIVHNAVVYTADSLQPAAESFAIRNGKFLKIGKNDDILLLKGEKTVVIDAKGGFLMPGLIEGHGHFLSLGKSLRNLNLIHAKSWNEIIDSVKSIVARTPKGVWIQGRGWHQEKWNDKMLASFNSYPYHDELSRVSPDHPVMLTHASGHALIANEHAMNLAGLSSEFPSPKGGRIVKDAQKKLTGVFEENAMEIIENLYNEFEKTIDPVLLEKMKLEFAQLAESKALSFGITSFEDAGTSLEDLHLLKSWYDEEKLKIRLYAMLYEHPDSMIFKMKSLPIHSIHSNMFKSIAIKSYMDGALGSYGAWLLNDYADNPGMTGQNLIEIEKIYSFAELAMKQNLQVCVHAIGDRANREVLNIFEKFSLTDKNFSFRRWRMEHAQHVDKVDIPKFQQLGVIASMQAIHCTSDAPFVIKRLGLERAKNGAYVWRSILNAQVHLANGTDCPVESINPFECLYASITRKRIDNNMEFFPEQCMTRDEALKSYTIWNAYASHDEKIKGSISVGKLADFIILDKNLLSCAEREILDVKVVEVYINGNKVR